jgi:hypothetical protein
MTQQNTGRNNITISTMDGASVPIVSQTEIEPMKTALSFMLALITTTALAEPLPVPKPPARAGAARTGTSQAAHSARCRLARWRRSPSRQHMPVGLAREQQLLPAQRQMTGLNCSPVCGSAGCRADDRPRLYRRADGRDSARRARATATGHAMGAGWSVLRHQVSLSPRGACRSGGTESHESLLGQRHRVGEGAVRPASA